MSDAMPKEEMFATPASEEPTRSADGTKVYRYNDLRIWGAEMTQMQVVVSPNDVVEASAVVKSLFTQTFQSGPHHFLFFTQTDDTAVALPVFMGEYHWGCATNEPKMMRRIVHGAASRTVSPPRWMIRREGGPSNCR